MPPGERNGTRLCQKAGENFRGASTGARRWIVSCLEKVNGLLRLDPGAKPLCRCVGLLRGVSGLQSNFFLCVHFQTVGRLREETPGPRSPDCCHFSPFAGGLTKGNQRLSFWVGQGPWGRPTGALHGQGRVEAKGAASGVRAGLFGPVDLFLRFAAGPGCIFHPVGGPSRLCDLPVGSQSQMRRLQRARLMGFPGLGLPVSAA
jgi:hypothetical protein